MIAFWPAHSMWNMNVFEPPMLKTPVVWFGACVIAPSPLPTRRARLTGCPDWLMNVITEIGSSRPAAAFWSLQVAVSVPRPRKTPTACGAPGALSATSKLRLNACVCPTSATNLPGIRPLSGPDELVATSRPAA